MRRGSARGRSGLGSSRTSRRGTRERSPLGTPTDRRWRHECRGFRRDGIALPFEAEVCYSRSGSFPPADAGRSVPRPAGSSRGERSRTAPVRVDRTTRDQVLGSRRAGLVRAMTSIHALDHASRVQRNSALKDSPAPTFPASKVTHGRYSSPLQRRKRTSYASSSPTLCTSIRRRIRSVRRPLSYATRATPVTNQSTFLRSHQRNVIDVSRATHAEMSAVQIPLHNSMPITLGGAL